MANVELVIKIPEETAKEIKDNAMFAKKISDHIKWDVTSAIVNGISLPEGHGRLIDADKLAIDVATLRDKWNYYGNEYECACFQTYDNAVDEVIEAPTIIEADKETEE